MGNDGVRFGSITGDVTIQQAGGDIVAGDKITVQYITQQAAKQIVTAPYKFLNSYDISDRDIFFGRDAIIEELVGKLPRYKTLVINGRSGSGKTSLINAGLIPRLAENGYQYLSFRDYTDPIRQLRAYVAQDDLFKAYADQTASLVQFLRTVTRQQQQHLALIFDQFERFFVYVPAITRTQFIQEIKTCLDSDLSGAELDLIFAVREDYFGALVSEFETLIPTFFNQTDRFNLLPLTRAEAREAILRPLKNIPVHIGYNLPFVDEVLLPGLMGESEGGTQIDPPHLQIVCNQLYQAVWERYAADLEQGGVVQIDRQLYTELGETSGILRTYLDDFIDRAAHRDTSGRDVLRSMLKLMMETGGTRRFVSFPDLKRGLPDVQPDVIEQHIRAFQDGRIIETRGQGEAAQYSLSHEVMVAKVQEWFDERELERKKAQETLERGLAEWKSSQALLNEKQVAHIRKWSGGEGLSTEAEQLLQASQAAYESEAQEKAERERKLREEEDARRKAEKEYAEEQRKRAEEAEQYAAAQARSVGRIKKLAVGLVAFLIIAIGATVAAWLQQKETKQQLSLNYFSNGMIARDLLKDWVKAGQYFLKTAVFKEDPALARNAYLAGNTLVKSIQLTTLLPHNGGVFGAVFSQDETRILTWSGDGTARVWDSATSQPLTPLLVHEDRVKGAVFSRDETRILTWSDGTVRVWNSTTGQPLTPPLVHKNGYVNGAVFSRDETRILTWSEDMILGGGAARVWNAATGQPLTPPLEHYLGVKSAVFSRDETRILTWSGRYGQPGAAQVWDSTTGQPLTPPLAHKLNVNGAIFSQDETRILTWGDDGTARVWDSATGQSLIPPLQHECAIEGALFSQDETRILTWGRWDGSARVWDATTGQPLTPLLAHEAMVNGAVFSRDEIRILTWSGRYGQPGAAQVWDAATGQPLTPPLQHNESVNGAVFSRDETRILTWSGTEKSGAARVWDAVTGQPLTPPLQHNESVNGAVFSRDETRILTWSGEYGKSGTARVWDAATGQPLTPSLEHGGAVYGAAFSRDETRILTWGWDGTARVWEVSTVLNTGSGTSQALTPPLVHKDWVQGAVFSRDETRILTWSSDGTAQVWDAATGQPLTPPLTHEYSVWGAVFSQDETWVLTWSQDGTARVWDSATGQPLTPPLIHKQKVNGAVFNRDESRILTWSQDGTARVWNSRTGQPLTPPLKHENNVNGAVFNRDETRILTWSADGTARVWDAAMGQPLSPPFVHEREVYGAVFSRDETRILTWSYDGTAQVWDSTTGQPLTPPLEGSDAIFSWDESHILTWGGSARVWDSKTGQPLIPPLENESYVSGAVFNHDETRILTWGWDGSARVWNSATGQLLTPSLAHEHEVNGAVFSQDETRLLTWSKDGTARVWDAATGQPWTPPLAHEHEVNGAVFSQDETRLLSWSEDGTVRLWDVSASLNTGAATGQPLIPPLEHKDAVQGAVFSQDETCVLSWSADHTGRVWNIQTDDDFPREHLLLQLEVQSGTRLNDVGDVEFLSAEEWQKQHDEYETIAREHLKTCQFPRANLWLQHLLNQPDSCDRIGDWMQTVNPAVAPEIAFMYAQVCLARGDFWFREQDYARAERIFNTALQLQLDYQTTNPILLSAAYAKAGQALIETGQDVLKGIEYAKKSLEIQPYQAAGWAAETLAAGYRKQCNPTKARETLKEALATALNDVARKRLEELLAQIE